MKIINKRHVLIITLLIIEIIMIFLCIKSFSNKTLNEIKEITVVDKNVFTMYIDTGTGNYVEALDSNFFPGNSYELNMSLTECLNTDGNKINNILTYEDGILLLNSNKTVYCNLFFDLIVIDSQEFDYTGNYQEYIAKLPGYYYIEAYGAQGGSSLGGNGASTSGYVYLNRGEKLYIYVGGQGSAMATVTNIGGYNGGGYSGNNSGANSYGGGGATDIRYFGEYTPNEEELIWNSTLGLNSRIMVAAGGAGTASNYSTYKMIAGVGGALHGASGESTYSSTIPTGAKQNGTGKGKDSTYLGSFGYSLQTHTSGWGGGGGSGYYGGVNGHGFPGSGGSSFISGYGGVNALKTAKFEKVRYIKDCINGSSANISNHWGEIQALKNGENVAKGKPVTGTVTANGSYPYTRITDGNISTSNYAQPSSAGGLQCVTIDLQEEYNLDKITVWHYYSDGRKYNNHSLYVSSNKDTWTTIIDNRSGVVETSDGINVNHTNNTLHYSGKYFLDGDMIAGVNEGNGKAKISYAGKSLLKIDNRLDNVRYIKECIGKRTLDSCYNCRNFSEIQAIKDGVNVALNKTIIDGGVSYASGYADPTKILDGDLFTTAVAKPSGNDTITCMIVDLGSTYDLDEIFVGKLIDNKGAYFDNHSIYVSSDNELWDTILDNESGKSEYLKGKHFQNKYSTETTFYVGGIKNPEYVLDRKTEIYLNINNPSAKKYCITEENNSDNCNWKIINKPLIIDDFTLSSSDGEKLVYAYLSNNEGDIVEFKSDRIKLYENLIKVTYDANGGKFENVTTNEITYKYDGILYGTYMEPTRDISRFLGWCTNPECTNGSDFVLENATEDVVVYANWKVGRRINWNDSSVSLKRSSDSYVKSNVTGRGLGKIIFGSDVNNSSSSHYAGAEKIIDVTNYDQFYIKGWMNEGDSYLDQTGNRSEIKVTGTKKDGTNNTLLNKSYNSTWTTGNPKVLNIVEVLDISDYTSITVFLVTRGAQSGNKWSQFYVTDNYIL